MKKHKFKKRIMTFKVTTVYINKNTCINTCCTYIIRCIFIYILYLETMALTLDNLFDRCITENNVQNVNYHIKAPLENSLLFIALDETKRIVKYADEWLYLINAYYPRHRYYKELVKLYSTVVKSKEKQVINGNVVSFITSFSRGTVHGYTGLFNAIYEYIHNRSTYGKHKILVYKNSQSGLLQIIQHMVNRQFINKDDIVYLKDNVTYHFPDNVYFFKNKYHNTHNQKSDNVTKQIEYYIQRFIEPDESNLAYIKSLGISDNNCERLLILKSNTSVAVTGGYFFSQEQVTHFRDKYNFTHIEPGKLNEISLIHFIRKCTILVCSFGTAHFKNYTYITDKCKYVVVLVPKGSHYESQYNGEKKNDLLIHKYKNADIIYKFIEPKKDIDVDIDKLML